MSAVFIARILFFISPFSGHTRTHARTDARTHVQKHTLSIIYLDERRRKGKKFCILEVIERPDPVSYFLNGLNNSGLRIFDLQRKSVSSVDLRAYMTRGSLKYKWTENSPYILPQPFLIALASILERNTKSFRFEPSF
jgi:hypothetical protein